MIFGKITPNVTVTVPDTLTSTKLIKLDYMTAVARNYRLGSAAKPVTFEVFFGTVQNNDEGNPANFTKGMSQKVHILPQDLQDWGTDDKVALTIIANHLGISIEEFIELPSGAGSGVL